MPFEFAETDLPGVMIVKRKSFPDDRGFFSETYKYSDFLKNGIGYEFVQDNFSFSRRGVIRGLHFQRKPAEQGKLVSVYSGKVFDVAVDIRPDSHSFGKWFGVDLSEENGLMLWIPPGFAHGFQALEDSRVAYKVTSEFSKDHDGGVIWNDPAIGVEWPLEKPIISDKDSRLPTLEGLTRGSD